jgi:hypothetical protein
VGHGASLESLAGVSLPGARTLEVQDARRRALVGRIVAGGMDSGDFRPDLVPAEDAFLLTCALDGAASLAADRPDERGFGRRWAGPRYYLGPPQVVRATR